MIGCRYGGEHMLQIGVFNPDIDSVSVRFSWFFSSSVSKI